MKLRPRITVQFEITGKESTEDLADMKLLERECEILLAKVLGDTLGKVKDITLESVRDGNGEEV